MGQLMQYEEILQQETDLIYSPLSEVNMEGLSITKTDQNLSPTFPSPEAALDALSLPGTVTPNGFFFLTEKELNKDCDFTSNIGSNNYPMTKRPTLDFR